MNRDMTKGDIGFPILLYSLPMLAGNLLTQLYNVADCAIVGSINGKEALAAIGAAGPVMNILLFFIIGISMGSTILMSNHYGAGRLDQLKQQFFTSLLGSMLFTIIIGIIAFIFCPFFLIWIKTPAQVMPQAASYLKIIISGLIFSCIYQILSAGFRSMGNSRLPFYVLLVSTFINIGLDFLFVGLFKMGVRGAAVATVASQAVSAFICIIYLNWKVPVLRFTWKELKLDGALLKATFQFSSVPAIQQTILYGGRVLVQSIVNALGVDAVAAFNVTSIIDNYVLEPGNSLAASLTVFTAQNNGAGKKERIRTGLFITLAAGSLISILTALLVYQNCGVFIRFFLPQKDFSVTKLGCQYLKIISFGYILTTFCNSFQGLFRGLGLLKITLIATIIQIPIRIGVSWLLAGRMGISGISVGMMAGWIFMIAYEGFMLKSLHKNRQPIRPD